MVIRALSLSAFACAARMTHATSLERHIMIDTSILTACINMHACADSMMLSRDDFQVPCGEQPMEIEESKTPCSLWLNSEK